MRGMKQEALAMELGEDWSQKRVSLLEAKEEIDEDILDHVAKVLNVPREAIKSFTDDAAVNIIANTVNNHDQSASVFYNPIINSTEKWMEALEEIKKLNSEKIELYERMLKDKTEMIEKLEQMLLQKK